MLLVLVITKVMALKPAAIDEVYLASSHIEVQVLNCLLISNQRLLGWKVLDTVRYLAILG